MASPMHMSRLSPTIGIKLHTESFCVKEQEEKATHSMLLGLVQVGGEKGKDPLHKPP